MLTNLFCFITIICAGIIVYFKTGDRKRKKLNTLPQKNKEKLTQKVTKNDATGLTFGITKKGKLINNKSVVTESAATEEGHGLVVGGSGLGKTSALLIPTLKNWIKSSGTFICWDISGDIHPQIIGDKGTHGKAIIFEVGNPDSTAYSPFGIIDHAKKSKKWQIKHLIQLAITIMPKSKDTSEAGEYYRKQALKMLKGSLIAFYFQGMDFIEICEKIFYSDWHQLLNDIDKTGNQEAIRYINGFADPNLPLQFTSSAKQSLDDAIELFATNDNVKKILHRTIGTNEKKRTSWNPSHLEKNNVFIIIDDADLEEYQQLNCLIANQVLQFLKKRPLDHTKPILICMDEAASLGDIDILPALRKFRKRHTRILMLTQSLVDIDLTWGSNERKAMMTNFRFKVVLECSEPDEQEYWSKLAGKEWVWIKNSRIEHPDGTITYNEEQVERNIIEPWKLANLGDQLLLITPEGAQILEKNYYFR